MVPSEQDSSILPARVANHSAGASNVVNQYSNMASRLEPS